jgi:PqqD family protein of HPr-rel-A system
VRFQLKQFGSEAVVYDSESGDTHYLPPLALALLQIYREHPRPSHDDILRTLTEHALFDSGLPPKTQVDETLSGLRRIGLVSPK